MAETTSYPRLNIYLDRGLRTQIKLAAARRGITASAYCVEAIRQKLASDGLASNRESLAERRWAAAHEMDALREEVGPIGVPVSELIAEGRR